MNVAHSVLSKIIHSAPEWDDSDMHRAAALMQEIKPHHWGNAPTRRVAERVMDHLRVGRMFGFLSLAVELPDARQTIDLIKKAEQVENIRIGFDALTDQGIKADIDAALGQARQDMAVLPAITVTARLTEALESATSRGDGYRHTTELGGVVSHLREMGSRPGQIIRLGAMDRLLRWGGLPVSDRDGETVLVVAVSSHGKTGMAVDMALRSAAQGHLTHYNVMLDASAYQIKERMVHQLAGLSLRDGLNLDDLMVPRGGRPAESVAARLEWAESLLNDLPLYIDDSTPHMNQHELRVHLAYKASRGVRLSVFDNLDHFTWDQKEEHLERRFQLGRIANIIRASDRRTGHHSIILAQASRAALEDGDGIPRGHHVADSDQVRRPCTIVLGLLNPNLERGTENLPLKGFMSKNRQGNTGPFQLPPTLINPALQARYGLPE